MIEITSTCSPIELDRFVNLFVEEIGHFYPYSTRKTAQAMVASHKAEGELNGYFTLRRRIWRAALEGETIGYMLATEKAGGSVKFGPTVIEREFRGKGAAKEFRLAMEAEFTRRGFRKAYSTSASTNGPVLSYVLSVGYKIEAHLEDHFDQGSDEIVFGKLLSPTGVATARDHADGICGPDTSISERLASWYCDLDSAFADRLHHSTTVDLGRSEESFVGRKRKIFMVGDGDATAVAIPKRGWCVQLFPFILGKDRDSARTLLKAIRAYFGDGVGKFYTIYPISRGDEILELQALGFRCEGVIREPYRRGEDMVILSSWRTAEGDVSCDD